MKPLYIVGTHRHVGKTTFSIGLINAFRLKGLSVAYIKPLGQRVSNVAGQPVHDDALVVSRAMNMDAAESKSMAVPLTRGRVEKEIYDLHAPELADKVAQSCAKLREDHDVVVVEGMGHVAMGSCLKLSAADVARVIGARTMLVSGGGIGRAIDDISLCSTFLNTHGADMMGVVINKVWPAKFDRVKQAVTKGLENLGIRSYGTVPYEETLAHPTVGQVAEQLKGEVLCGVEALGERVGKTIVAAMETYHMVSYLTGRALVITPGDRTDNILAILSTHTLARDSEPPVVGIVLTGGFRPTGKIASLIAESGLPTLLSAEDTYTVAAKLKETVFKIVPDDQERIEAAIHLVSEYVDIDDILNCLRDT